MDAKTLSIYLQDLAKEDQKRIADLGKDLKSAKTLNESLAVIKPVAKVCQETAETMVKTIYDSGIRPTISNIGEEASNAIILVALHSYISLMEDVKKMFDELIEVAPKDLPLKYLAVLGDRIEVIKKKKQIFGTISYEHNNKEYFVPIKNLKKLNERRELYLLPPCDMKKITKQQKSMSEEEYLRDYAYMDKKVA